MKVFISHAFGEDDEELAGVLKDDLDAAGLEGYLAERTPRYDLPISDKIRREIERSDWLVAVITKRSHASASVHEEIGYALGKGVEVAPMVEEGAGEGGVLVYGREAMRFRAPAFSNASRKMARFVADSPRPPHRRDPPAKEADALLKSRNILPHTSADFAINEHFSSLRSPRHGDKKPIILFTSCPHDLGGDADVTAREFDEWVRSTSSVKVDGQDVRVLGAKTAVDIKKLVAVEPHPGPSSAGAVLAYREFQSSGFFEFGTAYLFIDKNRGGEMEMGLCYLIGEFWGFLAQARLFYQRTGLDFPLSAYLSVRNCNRLHLGNYGDEALQSGPPPGSSIPPTQRGNISLRYDFKSSRDATDEEIARAARKAAKEICNAYGETTPKCYDPDGSFSWDLWNVVARPAAGGGRL